MALGDNFCFWTEFKISVNSLYSEGNAAASGLSNKKKPQQLPKDDTARNEPSQDTTSSGIDHNEAEHRSSDAHSGESSKDSMVLLCCKDTVRLYHTKSVVQVSLFPSYFSLPIAPFYVYVLI